jgi:polyisoprenoid-binding protein YceI
VIFSKDGTYPVNVEGDLTMHGVTKKISIPGSLVVKGGKVQTLASFKVIPKDYNINIPKVVADKIAASIEVKVDCKYEPKQ